MGFTLLFPVTANIDEKAVRKDDLDDLVMALTEAKAEAISQRLPCSGHNAVDKPTLLITCDKVVFYEGVIREKPSSEEEVREFLKGYSGGHATTVSSVLVTNLKTGTRKGGLDHVKIRFNDKNHRGNDRRRYYPKICGGTNHRASINCTICEASGTTERVMGLPKDLTKKLIKDAL